MTLQKFINNIIFHLYKPLAISFGDITNVATLGLLSPPDQPAAPDYRGAAQETAAGNLAMAEAATRANRANQVTPWGTSTWTQDPEGKWTQTTALSPEQQNLYNLNTQTNTSMANLGLAGLEATGGKWLRRPGARAGP